MDPDHTLLCKARFSYISDERKKYRRQWPNYCIECDGWGFIKACYVKSHSDNPITSSVKVVQVTCPECLIKDLCPRCGQDSLSNDTDYCGACGWDEDEGLMSYHECYCI